MPIIATPIMAAPVTGATGDGLRNISPKTSRLFGCEIGGRMKAVETRQGQLQTIKWVLTDPDGAAVDLSSLGDFPTDPDDPDKSHVQLDIRETVIIPSAADDTITAVRGVVTDSTAGAVQFTATTAMAARAGIYAAEITVFDSDNLPVFSNQFYYVVNRSIGQQTWVANCPPSIAELRLHLRDSGAKDNPLLDAQQFDLAEMALAIERPILYWNESLPSVQKYTTTTFPYRYNWMEAAIGELYRIAAHFYRRNNVPMQGGGFTVNDLNKSAEYEAIADKKWQEYQRWALQMKVSINARSMVGIYSPGYQDYTGNY